MRAIISNLANSRLAHLNCSPLSFFCLCRNSTKLPTMRLRVFQTLSPSSGGLTCRRWTSLKTVWRSFPRISLNWRWAWWTERDKKAQHLQIGPNRCVIKYWSPCQPLQFNQTHTNTHVQPLRTQSLALVQNSVMPIIVSELQQKFRYQTFLPVRQNWRSLLD